VPDREGLDARCIEASRLVADDPIDIAERLLRAGVQPGSKQ
jgi:hypothetical protein